MLTSAPALLCGALTAGGIALLIRETMPARPDLRKTLERLEHSLPQSATAGARDSLPGRERALERLGEHALARFRLTVPREDLDLLGISPARHIGTKIAGAVGGLLLPQGFLLLTTLMGAGPAPTFPLLFSLLLAAIAWVNTDQHARQQAKKARREWRYVIISFLQRARLERGADAGAGPVVHNTAAVGDGWIAERLRATLHRAELSGMTPWQALATLGERLQVPELAGPADAFALAGEGASVRDVLAAQAAALQDQELSEQRTAANAATTKAVLPATLLFAVAMALFLVPSLVSMMSS